MSNISSNVSSFTYTQNPCRIIFGSGVISQLPNELASKGLTRPLLLTTPEQVQQGETIAKLLPSIAGIFSQATMHTPTDVTERAIQYAKEVNADSLVAIGGGSTTGLGKAISIRTGLYQIAVATTYAGSEMTPILGETEIGAKTTRVDSKIQPDVVIYDVDFTLTLPLMMSYQSGINAIAHAVEALYAVDTNPLISLIALDGIRALRESLPQLAASPQDKSVGSQALYGAWLCATCLGNLPKSMGLHHKLCHTLGGTFNLPHAQTHTIVLPHALAYNLPALPKETVRRLGEAFGNSEDPVSGLEELLKKLGVERSLKAYGMKEEDVEKAVEMATSKPYPNPRELTKDGLRELIRRATVGESARA